VLSSHCPSTDGTRRNKSDKAASAESSSAGTGGPGRQRRPSRVVFGADGGSGAEHFFLQPTAGDRANGCSTRATGCEFSVKADDMFAAQLAVVDLVACTVAIIKSCGRACWCCRCPPPRLHQAV
jgi:hypothetical protein